jgi:hypothetical protein
MLKTPISLLLSLTVISFRSTEYFLEFDQPFDIQDEIEVLKRMDMALGLDKGECSPEALNMARNMIPPPCIPHLEGVIQ